MSGPFFIIVYCAANHRPILLLCRPHTPFVPAKKRFSMFARADDFFDTKVWALCHKGGRPRHIAALRIPAETREFIAQGVDTVGGSAYLTRH